MARLGSKRLRVLQSGCASAHSQQQCMSVPFCAHAGQSEPEGGHHGRCAVRPRGGLRPRCRHRRGRSHSTAGATASRRCCSGRTEGSQGSGSPCAVPPPRPPGPAPRGAGAPSQGTGAAPPKGPWRGRTAKAGCAGSRRPRSMGTSLGCSRRPPPLGGNGGSCSGPSRVFRLQANRAVVRAQEPALRKIPSTPFSGKTGEKKLGSSCKFENMSSHCVCLGVGSTRVSVWCCPGTHRPRDSSQSAQ